VVATLYDIHGNLAALEAVLAEIPDDTTIVVGGDVCFSGDQPSAALERLRALGDRVLWVRGNTDREITTESHLTNEQVAFLQSLPPTAQIDRVLYCHATPRNDMDIFTERTPRSALPSCSRRSTPTSSCAGIRTCSSSERSRTSA